MVRPVMPGTTSPAGCTSISTGSAPVIRLTASALATARSAAATAVTSVLITPVLLTSGTLNANLIP
jgi:hypothetical protein